MFSAEYETDHLSYTTSAIFPVSSNIRFLLSSSSVPPLFLPASFPGLNPFNQPTVPKNSAIAKLDFNYTKRNMESQEINEWDMDEHQGMNSTALSTSTPVTIQEPYSQSSEPQIQSPRPSLRESTPSIQEVDNNKLSKRLMSAKGVKRMIGFGRRSGKGQEDGGVTNTSSEDASIKISQDINPSKYLFDYRDSQQSTSVMDPIPTDKPIKQTGWSDEAAASIKANFFTSKRKRQSSALNRNSGLSSDVKSSSASQSETGKKRTSHIIDDDEEDHQAAIPEITELSPTTPTINAVTSSQKSMRLKAIKELNLNDQEDENNVDDDNVSEDGRNTTGSKGRRKSDKYHNSKNLESIDLSLLTQSLLPPNELVEEDKPWNWEIIFTEIASELSPSTGSEPLATNEINHDLDVKGRDKDIKNNISLRL
ncbi:hypothetical protein BKA69DRAFT_1041573 [Paraphysoderma sedebokerense]|nr:hypothetical protein BKA69DRAFT_1041573 [Paraphysoderma sedebokerense]